MKTISVSVNVPEGDSCHSTRWGYLCNHIEWADEYGAPAFCPIFLTVKNKEKTKLKWESMGILKCWQCKKANEVKK